ncbi:NAD(P)-dependent oxidoreductase [Paraburkholderia sp. Cy-641]|uniref:NAD-dependent epimerase/dehydratase family protein n=1 Tax=Paraburkholderia sp. Cy-641 TaxID=2608337 RepID=UPI00142269D1|nr:NAD(P)-dependent oxidoreductase [Paraburkholderia sp. Cy-641]NIF75952.1 NAD(P)-dependent oxidoreductase [Paraburkholderia sp. Cy-641]
MASRKVFVAGATGAIGQALVPMLVEAGYAVYGSTRQAARAPLLEALGATPVVLDVFDAHALDEAFARIVPDSVIHQLTDLPAGLNPTLMREAVGRNTRVRDEGTRNLVAAAVAVKAARLVAQSIAWAYRAGPMPFDETAPLDVDTQGDRHVTINGVVSLERQVLAAPLVGTVLRYGQLYGPGTGAEQATGVSPVHVVDAARAACLALKRSEGGIYNIAEDNPAVSTGKAKRELGWHPSKDARAGHPAPTNLA